jgi:hypothetical protein
MRTGKMPVTSRSWSSSDNDVGSSRAEKPLTTFVYRYSDAMRAPTAESRARNCSCCATAAALQAVISFSVASPPFAFTRAASDGGFNMTT